MKSMNSNFDKKIHEVRERISAIKETQKNLTSVSREDAGDKIQSAVQEALADKRKIDRRSKNLMVFKQGFKQEFRMTQLVLRIIRRFTNKELEEIQVE